MDPEHPLSLLNIQKYRMRRNLEILDNTIGRQKHKETSEMKPIGGQRSNAQELLDLANQRPRSDRKSAISGGKQRLSVETTWNMRQ